MILYRKLSKVQPMSYPITGFNRLLGLQEVEVPRFQDSRHMRVVRSAVRTGRFYPRYLFLLEVDSTPEP
jgi:hypothetical protein